MICEAMLHKARRSVEGGMTDSVWYAWIHSLQDVMLGVALLRNIEAQ